MTHDETARGGHPDPRPVLVSLAAALTLAACGLKEEPQWENAPDAQQFFGNSAAQQSLAEGDTDALSLRCRDLLPPARAALEEPGSPGLRVLIQVCAQEGLGFGGELRCEDDTLQVSCL